MSKSDFKDHFSGHSALYRRYRPDYPAALYSFLASQAPAHRLAWDCATGSGQAAVALTRHFEHVIATDASGSQLANATPAERLEYRAASAEASGLKSGSVDLITVAQALHWFDLDAFYNEAERVLKPGGILAVWCYNLLHCSADIDALLQHYYDEIVGPYWPPERVHIERGYSDLPFPFTAQDTTEFAMQAQWSLEQLLGYLASWSATQRYIEKNCSDPVQLIRHELTARWGDAERRPISWPLTLRWGRKPPATMV